ncbi:MAG: hypothetical protein M3375_00435 [Actinomycetota bacterium]|nr:hypothetical protein [Actinomycetota bacterium]
MSSDLEVLRGPLVTGWSPPLAGQPAQQRHQGEVQESVRQLAPVVGLEVDQQVELAAVKGAVTAAAERYPGYPDADMT